MTTVVLDANDDKRATQVDLGNGSAVSMQTVQHIYNEITGRAEELSRSYTINHCTSFEDIKQLNVKICQLYEQYNIVSKNCSITLYHLDDQKQVFSSFERFELYDRTTLSPVDNIRLVYNFLIVLPQLNKPQSYQIELNIQSRASISKRLKQESSIHSEFLFGMFEERTALVEIKYIDYTVARNFQVAIDGWFKGLSCSKGLACIRYVKRLSENIPLLFRFLTTTAFLCTCLLHFTPLLSNGAINSGTLYYAATVTFGGATLLGMVAIKLGTMVRDSVRKIRPISYLDLTRGDQLALLELKSDNLYGWTKGLLSIVATIVLNLVSSWFALKMGLGG
ncbi:MAG: hypothetical protein JWL63_1733 [Rhodocyclales bacterium]|nr:hypothetical protein [Rhodocyclales bacterium]